MKRFFHFVILRNEEFQEILENAEKMEEEFFALYKQERALEFDLRKEKNLTAHLRQGIVPLYPDVFPVKLSS